MSRVEMFVTGSILNQSKPFLRAESKDQDGLSISKMVGSGLHDCNLTFDPLKIKQSSTLFAGQKP